MTQDYITILGGAAMAENVYVTMLEEAHARIARPRLFLGEIAAMGPADEEWNTDTLEHAVELAKRALNEQIKDGEESL